MSLTLFFGCLIWVFGPLLALFIIFVAKKAQNVILSMGSAFMWTVAILVTAAWWMIVKPLRTTFPFIIPFSVLFQESARYATWRLYYYAYHKLDMFKEDPSKPSVLAAAISVGWGIAATMALVMQASLLFSATGPADLPAANCPSVSAFHVQALLTLPIALLHILLTVILFDAYQRKSWFIIGLSVFLHLVASFSSVINEAFNCAFGILLVWSVLAIAVVITWRSLASPMSVMTRRIA